MRQKDWTCQFDWFKLVASVWQTMNLIWWIAMCTIDYSAHSQPLSVNQPPSKYCFLLVKNVSMAICRCKAALNFKVWKLMKGAFESTSWRLIIGLIANGSEDTNLKRVFCAKRVSSAKNSCASLVIVLDISLSKKPNFLQLDFISASTQALFYCENYGPLRWISLLRIFVSLSMSNWSLF